MKRLVIIDGKSVFYRGYYAMSHLSKSDGTSTGGVFGFAMIAMEIVRKLSPDKVVVAWDKAGTSISKRKAIFSEYKAGRQKPPEDFFKQIPDLKGLIEALSWGFLECDGYEADDIIGTLAHQGRAFSSSTDALLARSTISTSRSATPVSLNKLTPDAPKDASREGWEVYIISSDLDMLQVVDENVKMYRLLKGFSEIEEIDVAALEAKYGIRKEQFLDLKALKGDASDNIPGVPGVGEKTAVKLLSEYGTLEGVYENIEKIKGALKAKLINGKESAFMSYKLGKIMTDAPVSIEEIPDLVVDGKRIMKALKELEFSSLIRKYQSLLCDSLNGDEEAASGEVKSGERVDGIEVPELLFEDVKLEMHANREVVEKVLRGEEFWDLGQGEFLLNPLRREKGWTEPIAEYWRQKEEFERLPRLYSVFRELDLPLIPILYKMEEKGILIDRGYFSKLKEEYEEKIRGIMERIYQVAGGEFNLNSPAQLSDVLYVKLGLSTKGVKRTKRGYSTGVKELEKLKGQHPIIETMMEYREMAKLLSTYISPLPELADGKGRIHTTFTQNITATGRLSSVNPNLQNIPVRTEAGRRIRTGFVAPEGKVFISADYAQFELRLAAVLSGDMELVQDFNSGVDIHTKTAVEVYQVPLDMVTAEQRRAAKVINFGVLYGMSAKGLSEQTGMSLTEAGRFIESYFSIRKPIREYLDRTLVQAREEGFVETFFGRRRPTPDVKSANFVVRMGAERAAQNMPIQGTEADLMKRAMIRVSERLPKGAELVLQIHDSLVVEAEDGIQEEVSKILVETMEGVVPELKIKLMVDVTSGKNWGELHA